MGPNFRTPPSMSQYKELLKFNKRYPDNHIHLRRDDWYIVATNGERYLNTRKTNKRFRNNVNTVSFLTVELAPCEGWWWTTYMNPCFQHHPSRDSRVSKDTLSNVQFIMILTGKSCRHLWEKPLGSEVASISSMVTNEGWNSHAVQGVRHSSICILSAAAFSGWWASHQPFVPKEVQ